MALSIKLEIPIIYLFPGGQEKPALALCIVAILPRVIAPRNKVTKYLWPFWLYPNCLWILETKPLNACLAAWIASHSMYSFKVHLAKLSFQSAKLARGKKCHSQRHLNL